MQDKCWKKVEGVCGGFAKYFGIDVSIVRFIWLLFCLAGGIGMWLYLISRRITKCVGDETERAKG